MNGSDAFSQIVQALIDTEKVHLHDEVVERWHRETQEARGREVLVEEAFAAYNAGDPESSYDERLHPAAFSEVLKPPAQRYNRKHLFEGKDVITQLSHITIIDRNTGAVEIQDIDPAYRSRLTQASDPLVVAILDDHEYFMRLPHNTHLVIYRKPGRDGKGVWDS